MSKKLVLVRGIPGSGKSTLAKSLDVGLDYKHLEADMYFMVYDPFTGEYEYKFDADRLHKAHVWCQDQTNYYLEEDYTVIVSNTFKI